MGAYKQKQDMESILCHWEIHDATLWRFGLIKVYWSVLRWIYLFISLEVIDKTSPVVFI